MSRQTKFQFFSQDFCTFLQRRLYDEAPMISMEDFLQSVVFKYQGYAMTMATVYENFSRLTTLT